MRHSAMRGFDGVSPAAAVLFAVSAVMVGALGSAKLWGAHFGGNPIPFGRMLPVILVAELLAYFAAMLIQLGEAVSGPRVVSGVAVGIGLRLLQSLVATVIGAPEDSDGPAQAFAHYYASYYPAALLQIAVTTLFLWLVRGAFEPVPRVLTAPVADVPDMEPERVRGFQEVTPKRRQQLIEALRREATAPEEAEPLSAAAKPKPSVPEQQQAQEPPLLTPQQSVILALQEDDEQEPPMLAPVRPEPSPVGLERIAQIVSSITQSAGAGTAKVARTGAGQALLISAPNLPDHELPKVVEALSRLVETSAALTAAAGLGAFTRVFIRLPEGCVGGTLVTREGRGFFAAAALPPPANLGVANVALSRLEGLATEQDLPTWPPLRPSPLTPAYHDADLQARVVPWLDWVPEAAGLAPDAMSVGGRQVVVLRRTEDLDCAGVASSVAAAFAAVEELCLALSLPASDLVLWSADQGAVACGPAAVGGQHLLVVLIQSATESVAPANVQLGQILNGLRRVATEQPGI